MNMFEPTPSDNLDDEMRDRFTAPLHDESGLSAEQRAYLEDLEDKEKDREALEDPHPDAIVAAAQAAKQRERRQYNEQRPKIYTVSDKKGSRLILATNADAAKEIFEKFQSANEFPMQGTIHAERRFKNEQENLESAFIRNELYLMRGDDGITYHERSVG